jgi:Uma2 family endonuclease
MTHLATHSLPMDFGEFVAFLETRPDHEKWELIEGRPVLSPSPVYVHQLLVANLIGELREAVLPLLPRLAVIPGIGVKVNERNAPVPDVMIRPLDSLEGSFCDDIALACEVLSPGTARYDRKWKVEVYTAMASLHHYLILSPKRLEATLYSRADGFAPRILRDPAASLDLGGLGVALPLASLYRDTGLA